jgi:hypothetical protein
MLISRNMIAKQAGKPRATSVLAQSGTEAQARELHARGVEGTSMIRTVDDYRAGLRDGREIWIDGDGVTNVTSNLRDAKRRRL